MCIGGSSKATSWGPALTIRRQSRRSALVNQIKTGIPAGGARDVSSSNNRDTWQAELDAIDARRAKRKQS